MAIELPHFDLPRFRGSAADIDLPHIEVPKIDLSKVELPKVDIPRLDLPAIGRKMDGMGRDLRSLRVVREPSVTVARARAASTAGIWLLGGLGTGMALMYFFDPRLGGTRRQRLAARIGDLTGMARRAISGFGRDVDDEASDTDLGSEPAMRSPGTSDGLSSYGALDTTSEPTDTAMEPRMPEMATTQRG